MISYLIKAVIFYDTIYKDYHGMLIIQVLQLQLEPHTIQERFSRTVIPQDMKQAYALDLVLFLNINSKDRCLQV